MRRVVGTGTRAAGRRLSERRSPVRGIVASVQARRGEGVVSGGRQGARTRGRMHGGALGLLHVWEAERRDRRFGRASRELGVPLTAARGIAMTAHPDSCTRALCAGAGIQTRRPSDEAFERERYTELRFRCESLPGEARGRCRMS